MGSQRVRHSIRQILKCWDFLRYHRSSVFPSKEMRTSSSIFRHKKKNFIILFMSTCHKTIAQHLYTYMIMIINFIRNTIPFNHFKALCMHVCVLSRFSRVQLFVTLWTVACQAPPLSMGFSRQEYWSGLPFSSLEDLPNPGIELRSPALQADFLPSEPPGKPLSAETHPQLSSTW